MVNCSIIIPHHNLPKLLCRSLASIPESNTFEVIVVDDNSSDDVVAELNSMQLPSNVRIIYTKEGKGAGYARNIGLENANGKWLLFCDSDDYFTPQLEKLIEEYVDSEYDVVFFGFNTVDSDTLEAMPSRVIGSDNAFKERNVDYFKYRFHGPWAKFIRKSLVDRFNIKFDEVICSNDTFFAGLVGFHAQKVEIDSRPIYVTVIREGSLVHSMNLHSLTTRIDVSLRYNKFLRDIVKKNQYRINMISLFMYLREVDKRLFNEYMATYFKEESINNIVHDFNKSLSGYLKQKLFRSKNLRKYIKITEK